MRSKQEIEAAAAEFRSLVDMAKRKNWPGVSLSQAEAMAKIAEALEWAGGAENGFGAMLETFAAMDSGVQ